VILRPRTLNARLTLGYALAFFAGLTIFAALSFVSLDAALKTVVDARLLNAQTAILAILTRDSEFNHATRERLELVIGSNLNVAVFSGSGRAVFSSIPSIEPATRTFILRADATPRLATLPIGGSAGRLVRQRIRTHAGSSLVVGVWRQLDLVQELERLALIIFGAAVVIIAASAVLVGSLVARQGLSPLRSVATLASEIEASDLSRRLGIVPDASELGDLATTFDRMLARLEAAFERQRRFTADASHELRAPLSVIQIAAELALRRDRDLPAYKRVLTSILEATARLVELTDRLLQAARADAGWTQFEPVDLGAVAHEAIEHALPLAKRKGVALVAETHGGAFAKGERSALSRAVVALLDNAIKISSAGQTVAVTVTHTGQRVSIAVRDQGPGFSAEGLAHATERFWRDDRARAPGSGSGLGLAISDSIVRACGGNLTLENASAGGAAVAMTFPAMSADAASGPVI
jgi:signal transduction histidine kinase